MKVIKSIVASVAVLGLAACSKGDLYDANQVAANKMAEQKQKFETNFEAKYGKVDPNQSWDFSTNQQRLGTRGEGDQIVTELVAGLDFGIKEEKVAAKYDWTYYTYVYDPTTVTTRKITKNKDLFNVLNTDLRDKLEHEGEPVVLLAPTSDFTIYPISNQGAWNHDLYVKVGDNEPFKVYSKTWPIYGRPTVNGDATTLSDDFRYITSRALLPGVHIKAPIGTRVDVYIDNINGEKGNVAGTINGQAIYLDCKDAKPEGVTLAEDAIIKYIGIEDDKNETKRNSKGEITSGSDLDFNDVVLAVVGNPFVPEKITFTNNTYDVPLSVTKRYMMEDLGSTDDFDFNDVVVDVTETTTTHHKVTLANGVVTMDEVTGTDKTQKAVVRHLGGIYPFVLKVGNTTFDKMGGEDTFDKDINIEKDVTGWNPAQNNVSVTVEVPNKTQGSTMYNAVNEFPEKGAFPMMFACDPEVKWAAERQEFNFNQFPGYKGTK